jgi:uncharacterized membrane protein YfcA
MPSNFFSHLFLHRSNSYFLAEQTDRLCHRTYSGSGNMLGAFIAAKTAIKTGVGFIKWLIIAMVLFSAIQLFSSVN